MNAKQFFASRKGFTLIELLVVIGILAVLAAIAIPSVAGLIDRANKSADATNANEYTNAIERFASEYELYCQDIASGVIKDTNDDGIPDDMDAAQGRVFNVTGAVTRADITNLEGVSGLGAKQINRDTKYPVNNETLQAIVENYTKTSSATFEPKQSDCSYFYSPEVGVVIVAESDSTREELNALVQSGKDAKGNELTSLTPWLNSTTNKGVYDYQVRVARKAYLIPLNTTVYGIDEGGVVVLTYKMRAGVNGGGLRPTMNANCTASVQKTPIDDEWVLVTLTISNPTGDVSLAFK